MTQDAAKLAARIEALRNVRRSQTGQRAAATQRKLEELAATQRKLEELAEEA